jgi:tRNA(Ile)-lysidine synthase
VPTADAAPVSAAEAKALFANLVHAPVLLLAVSGGPDSTALLVLAARWRAGLRRRPQLVAVTIDHGLRPQSAHEAKMVGGLARRLAVSHRTIRWRGKKPSTGLQEAARQARYRLLAAAARKAGAKHILTAHTLDDQAETVLMRLVRGSGLAGLGAMAAETELPELGGLTLVRPLLTVPKQRLVATLEAQGVTFADDPSNRDPRFTRARLRAMMPALAAEGLDAGRLALLARRLRRGEAALEACVDAAAALALKGWHGGRTIEFEARDFARLPAEIRLRLLARAAAAQGGEGAIELGKLEALGAALDAALHASAPVRFRRTLAGAMVTLTPRLLIVERAPPRASSRHKSRP